MEPYATITIEMSKAGLHCICDDIDEDVFCINGDLSPLVDFLQRVETVCNPDTVFSLTEKGKKYAEELKNERRSRYEESEVQGGRYSD